MVGWRRRGWKDWGREGVMLHREGRDTHRATSPGLYDVESFLMRRDLAVRRKDNVGNTNDDTLYLKFCII